MKTKTPPFKVSEADAVKKREVGSINNMFTQLFEKLKSSDTGVLKMNFNDTITIEEVSMWRAKVINAAKYRRLKIHTYINDKVLYITNETEEDEE